jgi:hypothetical protein
MPERVFEHCIGLLTSEHFADGAGMPCLSTLGGLYAVAGPGLGQRLQPPRGGRTTMQVARLSRPGPEALSNRGWGQVRT